MKRLIEIQDSKQYAWWDLFNWYLVKYDHLPDTPDLWNLAQLPLEFCEGIIRQYLSEQGYEIEITVLTKNKKQFFLNHNGKTTKSESLPRVIEYAFSLLDERSDFPRTKEELQ